MFLTYFIGKKMKALNSIITFIENFRNWIKVNGNAGW